MAALLVGFDLLDPRRWFFILILLSGFILSFLSFPLFLPFFIQRQLYFVLGRHGLHPLLRSHHHLLVGEKALVQGLLDHFVLQALANEDEFLPPVAVRPLITVGLHHVLQYELLGGRPLPHLPHLTHPGTLCLQSDDVSRLLPATDQIVGGRDPDESFAPQQFSHSGCSLALFPSCDLLILL